MRRLAPALTLVLMLVAAAAAAEDAPRDWKQVASLRDRQRLRDWRTAWMTALEGAKADDGAAALAADPELFRPDDALVNGAMPAAGDYRCRRVTMGARTGAPALAIGAWGRCRIDGGGVLPVLAGLDGIQRLVGSIYASSDRRAVFLGTTMFADEHRPAGYGHASGRDMAGVIERIGERRWRLVLPYPPFGSALDLIELVPA